MSVLAWCLMENHVHLLVEDGGGVLSSAMHRLGTIYARHYNERAGRVGHLFRGRFLSSPVETESYLLEAVRYIHNNPSKAGLCPAEDYRWSSYRDYLSPGSRETLQTSTEMVLELLGGVEGFLAFSSSRPDGAYRPPSEGTRLREGEVSETARHVLGETSPGEVRSLPRDRRNALLRDLRDAGLSIRQVERLTGVGRNIVARV